MDTNQRRELSSTSGETQGVGLLIFPQGILGQHIMVNYWLMIIFICFLGCCLGSFLNVCIYRLLQNLSIAYPRSFCPRCSNPIRAYDNIPLLSYLFLRGKCRHCGEKISWRYPLVEVLTGGLALALFLRFGLSLSFFSFFAFVAAMVVITFIHLDHRIIPDVISLPGIGIGFFLSFFQPSISVLDSLIGLVAGGGSLFVVAWAYEAITKREGMGGGELTEMLFLEFSFRMHCFKPKSII